MAKIYFLKTLCFLFLKVEIVFCLAIKHVFIFFVQKNKKPVIKCIYKYKVKVFYLYFY